MLKVTTMAMTMRQPRRRGAASGELPAGVGCGAGRGSLTRTHRSAAAPSP